MYICVCIYTYIYIYMYICIHAFENNKHHAAPCCAMLSCGNEYRTYRQ